MSTGSSFIFGLKFYCYISIFLILDEDDDTAVETEAIQCPFRFDKSIPTDYHWKPGFESVYDYVVESVKNYPDRDCFGTRTTLDDGNYGEYKWLSYSQMWAKVQAVGSALHGLGLKPLDRIGIISNTCAYFQIIDLMCQSYQFCSVPLYTTLGVDSVPYIINRADIRVVFSSIENFNTIRKAVYTYTTTDDNKKVLNLICPNLKVVVLFSDNDKDLIKLIKHFPSRIHTFDSIVEKGAEKEEDNAKLFLDTYDPSNPQTFNNGLDSIDKNYCFLL
jgi:long-subunit acyl-CoA synthetase (AMP-forming)